MSQQNNLQFDIIVVGGGIWGDSARQYFQEAGRSVCLIDDTEAPASDDVARIIRAEYSDLAYRELATYCLEVFRTQNPYKKYFHESGWFLVQKIEGARYESIPAGAQRVSVDGLVDVFPAANISDCATITTTKSVGWVEANSLRKELKTGGIHFHGKVTGLLQQGTTCQGVQLQDREIRGKLVILATGWRTNELLRSNGLPPMAYEIVGVAVLGVRLSKEQFAKYEKIKILCDPGKGEIIPPTLDGILRINNPRSFHFDPYTVQPPRVTPSHACFKESWEFLRKYCPDLVDCPVVIAKICLDALTDGQSFYVEQVDGLSDLICVGGGSFHSWKFRPILPHLIGLKVGDGDPDKDSIWDALSQRKNQKHAGVVPTREWIE